MLRAGRIHLFLLQLAALLLPLNAVCQPSAIVESTGDEIVVTARKVPELASRVPLSVQALSGDFLDARDLSSMYELQFEVPGLVVNSRGMFGAGFALRGVTDEGGGSLSIAPHLNGIYLGRSNLALARQFDVERIEVVKGPQGTLYGRNATGGSINVITRPAGPTFSAGLEGGYGSYGTARLEGHVNFAAERIAARVAVAGSDGDGFIHNSIDERDFSEEDFAAIRVSVRTQPLPDFSIDLTGQRVEDDGAAGDLWLPRRDFVPDPNDIWLTTVTHPNPYLEATDDLATMDLAFDLGEMQFRSIIGYARNVTNALDDCAGTPQLQGCIRGVRPLEYRQHSQEFRVESSREGSFQWLAGAFHFEGEETSAYHLLLPQIASAPLNDSMATTDEDAYAIFGDASHAISERWRVSGGLRISSEDNDATDVGTGAADNSTPVSVAGEWDDTSWRLGMEFSQSDRTLVFANVSTGFKSGGVTTQRLPNGQFDDYGPEEITAFEAGSSSLFSQGRSTLRASVFYYDFEDMQVQTVTVLENQVAVVIDNAAAARIHGLDVSASARFSDRVSLAGGLVWMPRREFVEFTVASSGASLSGNTISRAPEWSGSASLSYRVPIRAFGTLATAIDYNYRSAFFFTKENDPLLRQESFGLLNLSLRFNSSDDSWYVFATARNVLDTEYFNQLLIQSAPGYPAGFEAGFGLKF